jgi:hypothetical protein
MALCGVAEVLGRDAAGSLSAEGEARLLADIFFLKRERERKSEQGTSKQREKEATYCFLQVMKKVKILNTAGPFYPCLVGGAATAMRRRQGGAATVVLRISI